MLSRIMSIPKSLRRALVAVVLTCLLCPVTLTLPALAASQNTASGNSSESVLPTEESDKIPTLEEITARTALLKDAEKPDVASDLAAGDATIQSPGYTVMWASGLCDGTDGMVYYTEVSNLHYGWASPRDLNQYHYNIHTYQYSQDFSYSRDLQNWHCYVKVTSDGVWHWCAYDSVSGTFKEWTSGGSNQATADSMRTYLQNSVKTATAGAIILAALYITWQFMSSYGWVILLAL